MTIAQRATVVDFRSALEDAERHEELLRIRRPVEPELGVPGVMRAVGKTPPGVATTVASATKKHYIPAVLFEQLEGYPGVRSAAALFAEKSRLTRFLGLPNERGELRRALLNALDHPIDPVVVNSGPVQQNVITENIDIAKVIPPMRGALHVRHRYYQPVMITRNPDTGGLEAGIYRACIQGPNRVTANMRWEQHGGLNFTQAIQAGAVLPVAMVIGADPAVYLAAASKLDYGESEISLAGGIKGHPIDVVKCKTIDLQVPAYAEFVIEGEIRPPYEMGDDGPWPEYMGYLGMNIHPPIMEITAITYRDNPIAAPFSGGTVPNGLNLLQEAQLFRHLTRFAGGFVLDATFAEGSKGHHAIVKVRKTVPQHDGMQVAVGYCALSYSINRPDRVTLVDEDIDVRNPAHVEWAVCSRCNAATQMHVMAPSRTHENNPIGGVHEMDGEPVTVGKVIVDATIPWKYRLKEKGPGITFFTMPEWPRVALEDWVDPEEYRRATAH